MSDLFPLQLERKDHKEKNEKKILFLEDKIPCPLFSLPSFPVCNYLLGNSRGWIECVTIFRELHNNASKKYLRKRLKHFAKDHSFVQEKQIDSYWEKSNQSWALLSREEQSQEFCVQVSALDTFVTYALKHTRKFTHEKQYLMKKFKTTLSEHEIQNIRIPIELECLDVLRKICPFKIQYQYRLGKYRLDAFIPRLRIGIEIDENNHANYDDDDEKEYNTFLRDHNIVCIRFNPHQDFLHSPGEELCKLVWSRTLSPDFHAFRLLHQKV